MEKVIKGLPDVLGSYSLDEVQLTVDVSAEERIQLIGGVSAGATGGIALR